MVQSLGSLFNKFSVMIKPVSRQYKQDSQGMYFLAKLWISTCGNKEILYIMSPKPGKEEHLH